MARGKKKLPILTLLGLMVAAIAVSLVFNGVELPSFGGKLTYEEAEQRLAKLMPDIDVSQEPVQGSSNVTVGEATADLGKTLPDIRRFPLVVNPARGGGAVAVEIFVSTEKSGSGTDGWMVEAAEAFNSSNATLADGQRATVRIRKIASGTGFQFMASGKYLPDAFSPSNHLWVRMAEAYGREMTPILERTVGNVAGVVMKDTVAEEIKAATGALDMRSIVDAVIQGRIAMGYTNPYASSTGLNFLVSVLQGFGGEAGDDLLSPAVASAFQTFQKSVPFVAMTTLQMRSSVENDGSLDAFVMEYQTYAKTPSLKSGYVFVPFGVRHDNPLYAVGRLPAQKMEVLERFGAFLQTTRFRDLAKRYGFESAPTYAPNTPLPEGKVLVAAQKLWKEKKDAGRPILAIFLCDVSGSMKGPRIARLKQALRKGSEFISSSNSIGIVLFDDRVRVVLPVEPMTLIHKARFLSAVQEMSANGGTARYDGIAVALSMLAEKKRQVPEGKPLLVVLTDGETNEGLGLSKVEATIRGLNIPIYTIGFEANLEVLGKLSSLVEAASIKAEEEDLEFKISALLNAQM